MKKEDYMKIIKLFNRCQSKNMCTLLGFVLIWKKRMLLVCSDCSLHWRRTAQAQSLELGFQLTSNEHLIKSTISRSAVDLESTF